MHEQKVELKSESLWVLSIWQPEHASLPPLGSTTRGTEYQPDKPESIQQLMTSVKLSHLIFNSSNKHNYQGLPLQDAAGNLLCEQSKKMDRLVEGFHQSSIRPINRSTDQPLPISGVRSHLQPTKQR